jgi:energy-coupling factor transporter ATP-binding protein EcfA2
MINSIYIDSFKSIEELSIDLGQVNILIGANGSGKSNILEAIGVLSTAANGKVDDPMLLYKGVSPGVPALYKCALKDTKQPPHIVFSASGNHSKYTVSLFNSIEDPKSSWRFHTENWEYNEKKIVSRSHRSHEKLDDEQGLAALKSVEQNIDDEALSFFRTLKSFAIYSPNTAMLRGIAQDTQQREPIGLSGGGLPFALKYFIEQSNSNKFIDNAFNDIFKLINWAEIISVAPSNSLPLSPSVATSKQVIKFQDKFMKESRNKLSGYDASEGALYILFTAILALDDRAPEFLAIDNADHGLNPRLVKALMEKMCEWVLNNPKPRQIILTTHNPAVLDGLPLLDDRVRLFAVDRSSSGRSIIKRIIINEKIMKDLKNNYSLSRLWVMGHLGGVPNV